MYFTQETQILHDYWLHGCIFFAPLLSAFFEKCWLDDDDDPPSPRPPSKKNEKKSFVTFCDFLVLVYYLYKFIGKWSPI